MNKIDILAEQTKFLCEKQQEVLLFFKEQFGLLKKEVETQNSRAELEKSGEKLASFQKVSALLESQEGESIKELEEDVEFINEQYKAIEQVQKMDDPKQVEELTSMMLEEGHELTDTKTFKTEVEEESAEVMTNYKMMIDDIKSVLVDEGVQELESLLEAHAESRAREEQVAQSLSEEDESCEDEPCKDEPRKDESCAPSSCASCSGCNIFEGLEVELSKDEPGKSELDTGKKTETDESK